MEEVKEIGEYSLYYGDGVFKLGEGKLTVAEYREFQEQEHIDRDETERWCEQFGIPAKRIPFIHSQLPSVQHLRKNGAIKDE